MLNDFIMCGECERNTWQLNLNWKIFKISKIKIIIFTILPILSDKFTKIIVLFFMSHCFSQSIFNVFRRKQSQNLSTYFWELLPEFFP
jgi:hypothetical protein